mmetsp:Transcript_21613/g.44446  ORF Transcript_21613/g.44446 Transcript_21613/m.44446 type:complete len:292 (-) Transcript_21613:48-923(-)
MTKHDWIRNLHHGCLEVDAEKNVSVFCVLNFVLQEIRQCRSAHEGSINNLVGLERDGILENSRGPVLGMELDFDTGGLVSNRRRLFRPIKVSLGHVRDVGSTGLGPDAHAVRVFLCVGLDRRGNTAIRVSFSQNGIDGTTHDGLVSFLDFSLGVIGCLTGIQRDIITLGTQFSDAILELIQGSRNVGKLDNVRIRRLGQFPQIGEIVRNPLAGFELFRKECEDTTRDGNVAGDNVDIGKGSNLVHDRKETVGGQSRGLVGFRVNDRGLGAGKRLVWVVRCGGGRNPEVVGS